MTSLTRDQQGKIATELMRKLRDGEIERIGIDEIRATLEPYKAGMSEWDYDIAEENIVYLVVQEVG